MRKCGRNLGLYEYFWYVSIGVKFWKIQSKMGGAHLGGSGGGPLGGVWGGPLGGVWGGPLGGLLNISRFVSSETKSGIY